MSDQMQAGSAAILLGVVWAFAIFAFPTPQSAAPKRG